VRPRLSTRMRPSRDVAVLTVAARVAECVVASAVLSPIESAARTANAEPRPDLGILPWSQWQMATAEAL